MATTIKLFWMVIACIVVNIPIVLLLPSKELFFPRMLLAVAAGLIIGTHWDDFYDWALRTLRIKNDN